MNDTKPACADTDPELFFPIGYGQAFDSQIAEAKAICSACPFRSACLQFALEHQYHDGIWAGTTPDERKDLYPQRETIVDRPELDEQVAKMARLHMNLPQMAEALQVSLGVVRRCSRRNRAARKSVSA
jgi:WhiB family redox-sensing transcriptional regulator